MLVLAATPIGNLGDASPRLAQTIAAADWVFAEDTRQSQKLLHHLGIDKPLHAFHEHSGADALNGIRHLLTDDKNVVYISDAGMPGINDPGFELVRLAQSLGVSVDVIPGPSAVINALVLSGLPCHEFCFLGFFPHKSEKQKLLLNKLVALQMTAVFFEGPSRILATLAFLKEQLPQTPVALCREMTKVHQQVLQGKPEEVLSALTVTKGEFTLIIGAVTQVRKPIKIPQRYAELLDQGMLPSRATKQVAQEFRMPKREVYRLVHREDKETPET